MSYVNQRGAGGMPVFYGSRYQRGMGLRSMFKSFFRWIAPIVTTHAVPVLNLLVHAIKTATNITADAIDEKKFNKSVKERAKETIEKIRDKVTSVIQKGGKAKNYKKRKLGSQKKHNIKKFKKYQDIFENEFVT